MMPSKMKYSRWQEDDMSRALAAVRNGDMGVNEAARTYSVPRVALQRHLAGKNCFPVEHKKIIAFDIAERNEIPRIFSKEKRIVGKKLYYTFMRRHPELNLRQPESTSFARAKGFNKEKVSYFFDTLQKIVDENQLDSTEVSNVDETGLSTVYKKPRKMLAFKGKRAVGLTASGDRDFSTNPVCCTSVACQYVPLIIYKRSRSAKGLEDGAPPGTICAYYPESGYINKDVFVRWLRHFIDTVRSSKEGEVLLLLDGHSTHTRNLDAPDIARENGVIMLALSGHTTLRSQSLDVSFVKHLNQLLDKEISLPARIYITSTGLDNVGPIRCQKVNLRLITASTPPIETTIYTRAGRLFPYPTTALKMATTQWSKRQPRQRGRSPEAYPHTKPEVVIQFHILRLFGKAYGMAATIWTAVNGFTKTGVWTVNRDMFQDFHFVAAMEFETDDVPVNEASTIGPFNEEIPEPNRPNTVNPEEGAIASGSQDSFESLAADAATLAPKLQVSLGEIFSYTKQNFSRKNCK
ncbi:hypothetical protein ANN_19046 [Periplaneta americana]|uniref:HTH psq-type domain-containing protein n=1 Tax=Periplaneta americana TaxID=6978 RepID=A0ABQ8SR60_PERAM|nr:hypothetical protein ANN_19046 [Periplaneta americana]